MVATHARSAESACRVDDAEGVGAFVYHVACEDEMVMIRVEFSFLKKLDDYNWLEVWCVNDKINNIRSSLQPCTSPTIINRLREACVAPGT